MLETQSQAELKAVGHSTARQDGEGKVTGETRFTADLQLPGLLHARLVTSQYAHARIKSIDTEAARQVPGVVRVLLAQDLPLRNEHDDSREVNPLAKDEAFFYGQPIAVVLAETEAAALDGVDKVLVEYEPVPVSINALEAMLENAPLVRNTKAEGAGSQAAAHSTESVASDNDAAKLPANVSNHIHQKRGDVEAGFKESKVVIERTFKLPMVHQGYMETQCAIAEPSMNGGITLYTSTQAAFAARKDTAAALGLPLNKVKVVPMAVGGGFGGKFVLLEPWVAAMAKAARRPVKLVLYRMEDLQSANPAPDCQLEVKLGVREDGSIAAIKVKGVFDTGTFSGSPLFILMFVLAGYYRVDSYDIEGFEVMTNRPGVGAYRAPGAPQATLAIESVMDEAATALGRDPLEFRLQNVVVPGDPSPNGRPWPAIGTVEVLEKLQQHPLWQNRAHKQPGEGIGIALGGWPGGLEPASTTCRLDHDGNFTITTGVADLTGVSTSLSLIAAEILGMKVDNVTVNNVDTDSAPYVGASGGSKTLMTVGAAVKKAAEDAKEQILNIASSLLEAAPQDLELTDGKVSVKGVPGRAVTLEEIAGKSMNFGGRFEPVYGRGSSAITSGAPGFAAHLAKVKVDTETGDVQVLDYVAVQDVGKAINPAEVQGQIHGGVVQGLGWALYEELVYDDSGQLLSGSLMDYALQIAELVPPIQVELVEVPSQDGPFGAKGVGEPPVIPVAAAIANAIKDATGVRVEQFPATPERVFNALNG